MVGDDDKKLISAGLLEWNDQIFNVTHGSTTLGIKRDEAREEEDTWILRNQFKRKEGI